MGNALLYFVRYPEPGRVKTRLARSVGPERAASLYGDLAAKNFDVLKAAGHAAVRVVAFDPPERERDIRGWLAGADEYWAQEGRDLGERLARAFSAAFERGFSRVLAVGSDTLALETEFFQEAFLRLERAGVVIGPARDGGYYLIGMSRYSAELFENIPWSTPAVREVTLARAARAGLRCDLLSELEDLDEINQIA